MSSLPEKFSATIDECVAQLLTRAEDRRGLDAADIKGRVAGSVQKFLFAGDNVPQQAEIREFASDLRADDLCLIVACEKGDESAWSDLVSSFDSTVRSAARKITSNAEDAEDLASSIWAELYGLRLDAEGNKKSKLAYYSGRGSLGGWLRAVVAQLAVDQHRKVSKFVQVEEDRDFERLANDAAEGDSGIVSHIDDPEEIFSGQSTAADVTEALSDAVAELNAEDRLIMKLYYFDDLKLKDIAATFGYHEATASRKLARVQAEIRKSVERMLKAKHGWTETEVKRHLADTAAGLGINLETMFAVLALVVLVQDIWR